ncbi:MAG: DUF6101 family protein [Pseudomonadota bacterium]
MSALAVERTQPEPVLPVSDPVSASNRPHWARGDLRIDPYALPQTVQMTDQDTPVEYTVDRAGTVMKRTLTCGLPLSMSVPSDCFDGVAARTFEATDGSTTVTLELLHHDPALSVPLCASGSLEDVAADWHSWAQRMSLPMLLVDERGELIAIKGKPGLASRSVKPRRRRVAGPRHRPNFLRRRRTGIIGPVEVLRAEEIIARN